jgi:hypothetical protein
MLLVASGALAMESASGVALAPAVAHHPWK